MAAGAVTVSIVEPTTAAMDTAVTAARVTANDKYFFVYLGHRIMFIHIEEA